MRWILWGISLVVTQFFGTLTSRARNTASYGYHGVVAGMNHCSWFVAAAYLADTAVRSFHDGSEFLTACVFYTAVSTAASIAAHVVSVKFLEKGNRRVGAYGGDQR